MATKLDLEDEIADLKSKLDSARQSLEITRSTINRLQREIRKLERGDESHPLTGLDERIESPMGESAADIPHPLDVRFASWPWK